jgi:hypothetical protein
MNISIVTTQEEHKICARNMRNNRTFSTLRGTGILKERLNISRKMETQDAVIARKGKFAGFVISKVGNMVCSTF